MPIPAAPADSATVIVLRAAPADGARVARGACEVLLVERHAQSRAFAGASVFPGGLVDADDADPRLLAASPHVTPSQALLRLGESLREEAALTFWIAAVRELFEETGVLLADREDAPLDHAVTETRTWMHRQRLAILSGEVGFAEVIARERLVLRTEDLHYFSRWITPIVAPRRYDARFFVAELPRGQEPLHDERETIATIWITPDDAIARAEARTLTLAPPTLRTLQELRELGSVTAILEASRARTVTPILPRMTSIEGEPAILYPNDVEYDAGGPGVATSGTAAASARFDRMVMRDGVWRSIRTTERR
jgi:8-oxo-dGTP pyrophosphatase MutT (NUDIX family)